MTKKAPTVSDKEKIENLEGVLETAVSEIHILKSQVRSLQEGLRYYMDHRSVVT